MVPYPTEIHLHPTFLTYIKYFLMENSESKTRREIVQGFKEVHQKSLAHQVEQADQEKLVNELLSQSEGSDAGVDESGNPSEDSGESIQNQLGGSDTDHDKK